MLLNTDSLSFFLTGNVCVWGVRSEEGAEERYGWGGQEDSSRGFVKVAARPDPESENV